LATDSATVKSSTDAILQGGAPKYHEANAKTGKLFVRERIELLVDADSFIEDGLFANALAGAAGRRRGDRLRPRARPPGGHHGQRLHREGRLVGRPHRREDPPHSGDRAKAACAPALSGRLRRGSHHRSDRDVPRAPGGRPHLLQRGAAVGHGAPDLPALRPLGRRWCVHPGVLRRGGDGRQERQRCIWAARAWPRWSSARRSRSKRWAARSMHCSESRAAATCSRRPSRKPSRGAAATWATCRRTGAKPRPAVSPSSPTRARTHRRDRARPAEQALRHVTLINELVDAGSFLEVKALFAKELITGFARIDGHPWGSWPTSPATRAGCSSSTVRRQGRALHLAVRRVQHPAALPGRRARLHDRQRRSSAGHHPPRGEDDLGGERSHRAAHLRGGAQGLRRRPLRHVRPGLRARRCARAAPGR
jgi:hypothetical protein